MPAEAKPPVASNVIPFVREAVKESPRAKQLRALFNETAKAAADFWRRDTEQFEQLRKKHGDAKALKLMQAARQIVDAGTLKAGETSHALAVVVAEGAQERQKVAAKQPRHVARNRHIHDKAAEGKTCAQIAAIKDVSKGLSASQIAKILAKPRP